MDLNLNEISQKTEVKLKDLRKILWLLYKQEKITNNELLRRAGLPKSLMRKIKQELQFILEKPSPFVVLTPKGKKFVEEKVISPLIEEMPKKELNKKLLFYLKNLEKKRPKPKRKLDQFPATLETVVKRVSFIDEKGDLEGKRILFLGDFDLTSLGVAFLKKAKRVVVLDIDKRILDFIKGKARIETFLYDARNPLPLKFKNAFDLVFSDPPYTKNGLTLFLSRAVEAVGKKGVFYFCYGTSPKALERELLAQKIFFESELLILEKREKFNFYLGAESIGSRSSLYVLKGTPKTKALIKGPFKGPIYTFEV